MDIKLTEVQPEPQNEERLPWHKPEVQRLVVVLDTKAGPGSGVDAAFSD